MASFGRIDAKRVDQNTKSAICRYIEIAIFRYVEIVISISLHQKFGICDKNIYFFRHDIIYQYQYVFNLLMSSCLYAHGESCGRIDAKSVSHPQRAGPAEKHACQVFRKIFPPWVVVQSALRLRGTG